MPRCLRFLILLFAFAGKAAAEHPVVAGFERFYSGKPTADGGKLLYNELGCVNCHGGGTGLPKKMGPVLDDVAGRVHFDWLVDFLANPSRVKPGTTMPDLLEREEAEKVAHYLASLLPKKKKTAKPPRHVNAEAGSALYHEIGCVACHAPTPDFKPAKGMPAADDFTYPHIPLPDLQEKYDLVSLTAFLSDPHKIRPHGRMPKFELSKEQVPDIAGHLLDWQDSNGANAPRIKTVTPDKQLAEEGRRIFNERRCSNCHAAPEMRTLEAIPRRNDEAGCMSDNPADGIPRYNLSPIQRESLDVFTKAKSAPDPAEFHLHALNCAACHDRDGKGGPDAARKVFFGGDVSLGDTGKYPPPLTQIGAKLKPGWLAKVLDGTAPKMRPYLRTQMPHFGPPVEDLAGKLARSDRQRHPPLPAGDAEAGRKLLGTTGGVGCITCHQWGERRSLGIQALDISNMHERFDEGWLHAYLLNPASYRPGTLMPPLWPGGVASNKEILGGDTGKQISSVIEFARSGEGLPEGYPTVQGGQFEIKPTEDPIVLRTFMKDTGTHAILVGFPGGLNIAYDGKNCAPSLVWRGRFFDAYSTWFARFAPFESPLEETVYKWPAPDSEAEKRKFVGYVFVGDRNPKFYSKIGDTLIEDRFEPTEDGFKHIITATPDGASLRKSIPVITGLKHKEDRSGRQKTVIEYTWP